MTADTRFAPGQTLLIDADDTLWENNIYFERAIAAFISLPRSQGVLAASRSAKNSTKSSAKTSACTATAWSASGAPSSPASSASATEPITPEKHERILSFAQSIADQEIELLAGVAETLPDPRLPPQPDPHDQGQRGRTDRQARPLRPRATTSPPSKFLAKKTPPPTATSAENMSSPRTPPG